MTNAPLIKVLLVEDDEDDFVLARDMLSGIRAWRFEVDWIRTFDAGLQAALDNRHDVCLVDYRLGARNGVELLEAALTGVGLALVECRRPAKLRRMPQPTGAGLPYQAGEPLVCTARYSPAQGAG